MKKQNPLPTKAHVVRGTLYLLLLLSAFVIRLALGQQNVTDSAIDPTKSSFAVGHATSGSAEAQPSPVAAAAAVVAWDQYNNAGTAVTLSATFTDAPAMNSDLADDFVVQNYAWMVRWIDVDGAYFNGPGPANTFTVFFYADNDGFPGNQVYAIFAPWTQSGSTFTLHICDNPPCQQPILFPGKYWVEIQANMTATCCGEWGWTDRTVTNLDPCCVAEPRWFLPGLHELEPQGSHVRFRPFSAGSGLPNLCEPPIYADGHRDAHAEGDPDFEAASEPPASPDTVRQQNRRSKIS
jgi:hypothetical protein